MRKVFIDDLPRWKTKGKYIRYNWSESIGSKVNFIYDSVEGIIEILSYDKSNQYLRLKYNEKIFKIKTGQFKEGRLCFLAEVKSSKFKFSVGDTITDINSGKLLLLEQLKLGKRKIKGYKYRCMICGNTDTIDEGNLCNKRGCNVCCVATKKVVVGYNDIHTVDPEIGKMLWNFEDGYRYNIHSSKKVDFKCIECENKIKNKIINNVYKRRYLSCSKCGDGISFPNKFVFSVLTQAKIDFITEYRPEWAFVEGHINEKLNGFKRYDFYSHSLNFILEVHGGQHYKEVKINTRSLKEERENDKIKEKMYKLNDTGYYIVIKADVSELEYLKTNILKSDLARIVNLSEIDWVKCEKDSTKSAVKTSCGLWNDGIKSSYKISQIMKLNKATIIRYLKKGQRLGWCDYNPNRRLINKNN